MAEETAIQSGLDPEELEFYQAALTVLNDAHVPFMVGGAWALERYTGVSRRTKDIDIFVRPEDCAATLDVLKGASYATELTDPIWLAKAIYNGYLLDIIFSSGNGVCTVDDEWLVHAPRDLVLDIPVRLCAPEEMLWQKMYIMERERFDGADVAHLIHARGTDLDWSRLLRHMEPHWEVTLAHVVLYDFIYPGDSERIPDWVKQDLLARQQAKVARPDDPSEASMCQGTLISRYQYLIDVRQRGYRDARPRLPVEDGKAA